MRSWIRIVAVACALIMVTLAFQAVGAQAHTPNTGADEWNHARDAGTVASASGYSGSNGPANAIDGDPAT